MIRCFFITNYFVCRSKNQVLFRQCTCVGYVRSEQWARFISNLHLCTSVWYSSKWNGPTCTPLTRKSVWVKTRWKQSLTVLFSFTLSPSLELFDKWRIYQIWSFTMSTFISLEIIEVKIIFTFPTLHFSFVEYTGCPRKKSTINIFGAGDGRVAGPFEQCATIDTSVNRCTLFNPSFNPS